MARISRKRAAKIVSGAIAAMALAITAKAAISEVENFADLYPSQSLIEDFGNPSGAAGLPDAMPMPKIALELVKDFEKWMPSAYNDAVGYCTIGYGHLIALASCQSTDLGKFSEALSIEQGLALLDGDTASARLTVQKLVETSLTEDQFGSLASFVFNIGKGNFAKSTMLKLVNMGEHDLAAKEFGRWITAKGKVLDGLKNRRSCEEALYRSQIKISIGGNFDRNLCKSLGAAPDNGPLIDVYVGEN